MNAVGDATRLDVLYKWQNWRSHCLHHCRRQTPRGLPKSGGQVGMASLGTHFARVHRRYDELCTPLNSDHVVGAAPSMILPPIHVQWVWNWHTLNPISHWQYCEAMFQKVIRKPAITMAIWAFPCAWGCQGALEPASLPESFFPGPTIAYF